MADTRCQLECEDWVRLNFLPAKFGQPFHRERLRLSSGGVFDFDAVSADQTIAATISTSGATTASGKHAVGKVMKLRSDMLFLLLAGRPKSLLVLTEHDMYQLCLKERNGGRVPTAIEFLYAELPSALAQRLRDARRASSVEVSPRRLVTGDVEPV
jgi:hypothetical protein